MCYIFPEGIFMMTGRLILHEVGTWPKNLISLHSLRLLEWLLSELCIFDYRMMWLAWSIWEGHCCNTTRSLLGSHKVCGRSRRSMSLRNSHWSVALGRGDRGWTLAWNKYSPLCAPITIQIQGLVEHNRLFNGWYSIMINLERVLLRRIWFRHAFHTHHPKWLRISEASPLWSL